MMDIDVSFGIDPWPDDDADDAAREEDEQCDAQDHNDNRREEYRISNP